MNYEWSAMDVNLFLILLPQWEGCMVCLLEHCEGDRQNQRYSTVDPPSLRHASSKLISTTIFNYSPINITKCSFYITTSYVLQQAL
jgi:hypothetical protein